jgi:succinate dehydrogenase / fumarate reductase, cytochrome b subunit
MGWVTKFAKSSIGAKIIMALTGMILFGFVLVHMLGNLQVYLGQEAYNAYANFLKSTPELLWPARIVLILAVLTHIASGLRLSALNAAARPHAYAKKHFTKATITSRTMVYTGGVVLAFIVYHLLHFTLGVTDPVHYHLMDAKGRHDVYSMFVLGFQNIYVAGSYIVAMLFLFPHLEHGVSSMFQSLGINHPRYNAMLGKIGPVFATIVVLGNISMPVAVQLGWLTLPAGGA